MIPRGNPHANGGRLASYLVTGEPGERAELFELRGFGVDDIHDAFRSVEVTAAGTRCTQPFYHAYFRLDQHERLTDQQWLEVADRMEKRLGLDDQPRAVAFHIDEATGEKHMHVGWSRIDEDRLKAINLSVPITKMMLEARELEREWGLRELRSRRDPHEPRAPSIAEHEEARRLGVDIEAVRKFIRATYQDAAPRPDSGQAFVLALEEQGYYLANGDRRDFVVIDPQGGQHALNKKLVGDKAAEIRENLSDLDPAEMLSVKEAKALAAMQRQTQPELEQRGGRPGLGERDRQVGMDEAARMTFERVPAFDSTRELVDRDLRLHDGAAAAAPGMAQEQLELERVAAQQRAEEARQAAAAQRAHERDQRQVQREAARSMDREQGDARRAVGKALGTAERGIDKTLGIGLGATTRVLGAAAKVAASFGTWGEGGDGAPAHGSVQRPAMSNSNDNAKPHWMNEQAKRQPGERLPDYVKRMFDRNSLDPEQLARLDRQNAEEKRALERDELDRERRRGR